MGSSYFGNDVAANRREFKKAGGKEGVWTDFQRVRKHQNHLVQSGDNNESREKRDETQESSYLAILKPKYRKREHSQKLKPSWKTPLTHHTPHLGNSFALWISQSFLAGGPCGPCAKLSEEAPCAGVFSCPLTYAMTSVPVPHRCSPGCSICPFAGRGTALDLSWRSRPQDSLCLQELSPTAG